MKINILISYAYQQAFDWDRMKQLVNSGKINLLIDCGAFTAYKKKQGVNLDEYMEWLKERPFIEDYFALDVIGESEQTFKNFLRMQKAGLKPIPIFTRGDKLARLEEYYLHADHVALGGVCGVESQKDKNYVKYVMDNGFKNRSTHWLGFSFRDMLFHYHPYSFDSSSWKVSMRYGIIVAYDPIKKIEMLHRPEILQAKTISPVLKRWMDKVQVDVDRMRDPSFWKGYSDSLSISVASFLRYAYLLEQKAGVHYYFAIVNDKDLDLILNTLTKHKEAICQ